VTSSEATLTVSKATPTITWANPAAITYGTALSATQLNATASVPGSFVYTPAAGTVLPVGTQTLSVAFTPADTANYNNASATVPLVVNAAANQPPTVSLTAPADGAVLGAVAKIVHERGGGRSRRRGEQGGVLPGHDAAGDGHLVAVQLHLEQREPGNVRPDGQGHRQHRSLDGLGGGDGDGGTDGDDVGLRRVGGGAIDGYGQVPGVAYGHDDGSAHGEVCDVGHGSQRTDYTTLSGSVVIPAGASYADVTVTPKDDTLVEGKELVTMTLSADAAYVPGTTAAGTLNLLDNEQPTVTASVYDGWASEPGSDTGRFRLARTGSTTAALAVKYAMSGTAVNGRTTPCFRAARPIPRCGLCQRGRGSRERRGGREPGDGGADRFGGRGVPDGLDGEGTINLLDDELPIVTVAVTDAVAAEPSDAAVFTVTRGGRTDVAVTVSYKMSGGAVKARTTRRRRGRWRWPPA